MRCPIVKVAVGCLMEPAVVHIARVLQKLHFFQFFNLFTILHDLPQKKNTRIYRQKNTRLDDFLYTSYIFHT